MRITVLVRNLLLEIFAVVAVLLANVEGEESDKMELKIVGTQKTFPYTNFTGIPMASRPFLESIHLELVEFEPDYLVDQLEGCTNLEKLVLEDTHWKWKHFTRKVHLPKLFTFTLHLRNWNYKSSSVEEILSFYFAYATTKAESNSSSVGSNQFTPSLGFTSEISILSTTGDVAIIFYLMFGKLVAQFLPFDVSHLFVYGSLELQNTTLNVTSLKRIDGEITLENVRIVGGGMAEILAKSTEADSVKCDFQQFSEMEPIDMAQLPPNLRHFGISHGKLWTSVPHVNISTLETLTLKDSKLNVTLLPNFEILGHLSLTNTTSLDGDILFLTKMAALLETLELDSVDHFDISMIENSRETLVRLQISNMAAVQSSPLQFGHFNILILRNFTLDSQALTLFKDTFQHIKVLKLHGSFESMAGLLMEVMKTTEVESIEIELRGDQRLRHKPKFKEVNSFLHAIGVPPYGTVIFLNRIDGQAPNQTNLWKYEGYADDFTQNPNIRDMTLYSYIIPLFLICFIGITGNIVSGIVLSTKEMRSSTSCILLGLTLCDTTILTTYIWSILYFGLKFVFMFWNFAIPEYKFPVFWLDISLQSAQESENLQSLILYPLNKTAYTGSVYMTVLLTLERYVAVCWPLRSKSILTMKKAIVVTLSILSFSIVLNIPRWLEAQTNSVEEVVYGIFNEPIPIRWKLNRKTAATDLLLYTAYREFYHGWIWVTLMYIIPIPLLIGLNLKIWIQLKQRIDNQDGLTGSRNARNEEELATLTKLLICVAIIFIICNTVNGVVTLVILWYYPRDWEPADIEIFSCIPLIINSSVNFILYCLMGKKFRGILIKMLRKYCIFNWKDIVLCK